MNALKAFGVCAAWVLVLSACHPRPATVSPLPTSPQAPTRPPTPPAPVVRPSAAAPRPAAAPLTEEELFRRKSLAELNAEQPLSDAFFDYDQNTLRDDARAALQKNAAWLSRWPQTRIIVEGYCDERGSAEYNLALGERRATAVQGYLETLGISSARIRTVSLGKEARFCQEASEGCWSKNRRGHFVITVK